MLMLQPYMGKMLPSDQMSEKHRGGHTPLHLCGVIPPTFQLETHKPLRATATMISVTFVVRVWPHRASVSCRLASKNELQNQEGATAVQSLTAHFRPG